MQFAERNVSSFVKQRMARGEQSETLQKAILIERNKLLEKLFPFRYHETVTE